MHAKPVRTPLEGPAETETLRRLVNRRRLLRLVSFSSVQVMVQMLGFLAGLLLVRVMQPTDYGHYTALMTLVGLGTVLLDLGLSAAMLSLGGPHHAEPVPLARLLAEAQRMQRRLTVWLALPLATMGFALLTQQGLGGGTAAALVLLCLLTSSFNARNAVAVGVLRLRGDIALQQRLELGVHVARAAVVAAAVLGPINLAVAALTMVVPTVLMSLALARVLRPRLHAETGGGGFQAGLARAVRQQAPNSLYYCLSGQLPVWLVAWFGQTQQVAEVGALGRLALLFTVVGSVLAALVMPYFARPRRAAELRAAFLLINALFLALTVLLVCLAATVPSTLLWLLGPNYLHLVDETVWMVLAASLSAWSGAVYAMGAARGWVTPGWLVIPVGAATLALAVVLIDVSTVAGAFQLNTVGAAAATLLVLAFVSLRLHQHLKGLAPRDMA
jgi:O-antigen/teichoic acid export membrane protein